MITELLLIGLQVLCFIESCARCNWWKSLYWLGAVILTVAVVYGMQR